MPPVDIQIVRPANGAMLSDGGPVALEAQVRSAGHPPLFVAWFTSLHAPPPAALALLEAGQLDPVVGAQLNWNQPQALALSASLGVGTHIISVSVKELAGNDAVTLQAVRHAGAAGGPADAPQPCVVTVLRADLAGTVASLSRGTATLEAVAPVLWDKPEYQAVNRVGFAWRLTPLGAPAGRRAILVEPAPGQLAFVPAEPGPPARPPLVRRSGPLSGIDLGQYQLELRVFALSGSQQHTATRAVTIVA